MMRPLSFMSHSKVMSDVGMVDMDDMMALVGGI